MNEKRVKRALERPEAVAGGNYGVFWGAGWRVDGRFKFGGDMIFIGNLEKLLNPQGRERIILVAAHAEK